MVKIMEIHIKMDDLGGKPHYFRKKDQLEVLVSEKVDEQDHDCWPPSRRFSIRPSSLGLATYTNVAYIFGQMPL